MRLVAAALLLLGATLRATAQQAAPEVPKGGKDVVLSTPDGMKLAATHWHPEFPSGAGAVLLHMYRRDRTAWHPLVEHLTARGMDVLAVDMRGHGGSAKQGAADLTDRVAERDPALFAEMHRDAYAAVRWLVLEAKCDAKRIGIAGASVGCSVAIDTVKRHPSDVAAVVCMTPGANYLGLPSLEHAMGFPEKCALLLMTHAEEADVGAKALAAAVKHARLLVYDEKRPPDVEDGWAHGTRMFGPIPLAEQTVASFLAARTGSRTDDVVLDGIVEDEARPGGAWTKATRLEIAGEGHAAWAYRVGPRLVFGGTVPEGLRAVTWTARVRPVVGVAGETRRLDILFPFGFTIDVAAGRARGSTYTKVLKEAADASRDDFATNLLRDLPALRVTRTASGFQYEGEFSLGPSDADDALATDDPLVSVEATRDFPPDAAELSLRGSEVPGGVPVPSR